MNIDLSQQEDGSMPSLDIERSLDQIPLQHRKDFINLCCKKLAYGGILTIKGLHLDSFCKEYLFGSNLNLQSILGLQSVTNIEELEQMLTENGIKIVSKNINAGIYTIEASK